MEPFLCSRFFLRSERYLFPEELYFLAVATLDLELGVKSVVKQYRLQLDDF